MKRSVRDYVLFAAALAAIILCELFIPARATELQFALSAPVDPSSVWTGTGPAPTSVSIAFQLDTTRGTQSGAFGNGALQQFAVTAFELTNVVVTAGSDPLLSGTTAGGYGGQSPSGTFPSLLFSSLGGGTPAANFSISADLPTLTQAQWNASADPLATLAYEFAGSQLASVVGTFGDLNLDVSRGLFTVIDPPAAAVPEPTDFGFVLFALLLVALYAPRKRGKEESPYCKHGVPDDYRCPTCDGAP